MDRLGELGQTTRKAQIEVHKREIADLQNPELVAAKHAITLAAGSQAQLAGATAQASLPNVPLAGTTQSAQLKAALWDAQLHGAGLGPMQDVLMKAGWPVTSADPTQPVTPDAQQEIFRRYQTVLQHQQEMAHAQDFLAKTDKTDMTPFTEKDAQGNEVTVLKPTITYGGRVYDPGARDAVQKFLTDPSNLMPGTWDAKGKPASPSKLGATGSVSAAPAVVPITDAQRAAIANTNTGVGLPPEQAANVSVMPRAALPETKPIVGSTLPGGGIVTKVEHPLQDSPEKVLKSIQDKDSYKEWDKSLGYADLINQRNAEASAGNLPPKIQNEKDIALTEAVIKLYDPAGVMRSFKWDKTTETRPIFEYISELKPLLLKDQVLTTPQRERLTTMANDLISARERIVQPDLQRVVEVEKQWGRPVLNDRERKIASGTFSVGGTPATAQPKLVGPVVTRANGQRVARGADGQYYPAP
jgi:hypothetical protein